MAPVRALLILPTRTRTLTHALAMSFETARYHTPALFVDLPDRSLGLDTFS